MAVLILWPFSFVLVDCGCDLPKVTLELEQSLENATVIYSSDRFPLRVKFQEANCSKSKGYQRFWEVCKCEENTRLCNQMIPYGPSKPGRTKKLYPRLFGPGYMYIRCLIRDPARGNLVITYDYGYVRIILPPLVAQVTGPSSVRRGNESVVMLDASESYDPEKMHKKTQGLKLNWYCRQENVSHRNQDQLSTVAPSDVGGCHGANGGKLNISSPLLHIDVENLRGNNTYVFEVVVQKGSRSSRATRKLRVLEPFVLSIRWERKMYGTKFEYILLCS